MYTKGISRRSFTLGLSYSALGSSLGLYSLNSLATTAKTDQISNNAQHLEGYVSSARDHTNKNFLVITNAEGKQLSKLALPNRAHQISLQPHTSSLAIAARRPGTYLLIVNSANGKLIQELQAENGHHFYGHSVYSANGHFLYTSEQHIDSGEGRIVERDARADYKVLRTFPSYGIGPHEIKIHPDKTTLVVANGGILTHPDSGRVKLNLKTMSPSLCYISLNTGELLEQRKLPENLHQLSIRHIDINSSGVTAIAMQYQGDVSDNVPLIAIHERGKAIKTLWAPEYVNRKMKNYCGSICFNQSGSIFAVTSPRGNTITLWDSKHAEFISNLACNDVCGISPTNSNGFIFSNGYGQLYKFDMNQPVLKLLSKDKSLAWDNHLALI